MDFVQKSVVYIDIVVDQVPDRMILENCGNAFVVSNYAEVSLVLGYGAHFVAEDTAEVVVPEIVALYYPVEGTLFEVDLYFALAEKFDADYHPKPSLVYHLDVGVAVTFHFAVGRSDEVSVAGVGNLV